MERCLHEAMARAHLCPPVTLCLMPQWLPEDGSSVCRQHFRYLVAPSAALAVCILSLRSSELAAAESALRVAADLAECQLSLAAASLAGMSITETDVLFTHCHLCKEKPCVSTRIFK